jgi:hypothetical protein
MRPVDEHLARLRHPEIIRRHTREQRAIPPRIVRCSFRSS